MRHHRCATTRQSEPSGGGRHRMGERARRDTRIGPAIDRSLIDRARNGDLDAFETIVRARMDAVYRLTSAILGNEADARDAALETLPVDQRAILVLHYLEGHPLAALAAILDIPEGTAKSRLFTARRALG